MRYLITITEISDGQPCGYIRVGVDGHANLCALRRELAKAVVAEPDTTFGTYLSAYDRPLTIDKKIAPYLAKDGY